MPPKWNRWLHFRQIFLSVRMTPAIFLLFLVFLWCSFQNSARSHGIDKRDQSNRGAKAIWILIFLWRPKTPLLVTSSYIQKWICPGLFCACSIYVTPRSLLLHKLYSLTVSTFTLELQGYLLQSWPVPNLVGCNEVLRDWQNAFIIMNFSIHLTITELGNVVRYTGVFVI